MRCFIALPLPDELRDYISEALAHSDKPRLLRRIAENRWHLTLAFLGEIDSSHIPKIIYKLKRFVRCPGTISIDKLKTFPDRKPRLLVASGSAAPIRNWRVFVNHVKKEVSDLAPEMDHKPWIPHITIARASNSHRLPVWENKLEKRLWTPGGFTLVNSNLRAERSDGYINLHEFKFKH